MLPHGHLIISTLTIAPVAMVYSGSAEKVIAWVLVGGLATVLMDLDVIVLVLLRSRTEKRLHPYRSLVRIFTEFERFMAVLTETGLRDTVMKSHFAYAALIPPLAYFLWPGMVVPVALGVVSHLLSDLADINRTEEE